MKNRLLKFAVDCPSPSMIGVDVSESEIVQVRIFQLTLQLDGIHFLAAARLMPHMFSDYFRF